MDTLHEDIDAYLKGNKLIILMGVKNVSRKSVENV
jgi:hypothetical protein